MMMFIALFCSAFNPLPPYININILSTSLYFSLYISFGIDKENLFNDQTSQAGDHFLYSDAHYEWFSSVTVNKVKLDS